MLIKPASGMCNMRCSYCFYRDEIDFRKEKRSETNAINGSPNQRKTGEPFLSCEYDYNYESSGHFGIMSRETSENLIKRAFEFEKNSVTFAFQGGEPTLAGVKWFRDFSTIVKEYNVNKAKVSMAIQTNGLNLDDDFISYLKNEKFLVGLSVDGDGSLHNLYRPDATGKGTHSRALAAGEKLKKARVDVNILSVLTDEGARYISKTYSYLTSRCGYDWIQFIPCLPPLIRDSESETKAAGGIKKYSVSPERWLKANKILFDLWYNDFINGKHVSVRHLENYLMIFMGMNPESCDMTGRCSIQFVTESDGSVYPCDFYALGDLFLGNINTDSIQQIIDTEKAKAFIMNRHSDEKCTSCRYFRLCRGGCPRLRETHDGTYLLCPVIGEFFEYTGDRFAKMADIIRRKNGRI